MRQGTAATGLGEAAGETVAAALGEAVGVDATGVGDVPALIVALEHAVSRRTAKRPSRCIPTGNIAASRVQFSTLMPHGR
jgi:hypothetical protein